MSVQNKDILAVDVRKRKRQKKSSSGRISTDKTVSVHPVAFRVTAYIYICTCVCSTIFVHACVCGPPYVCVCVSTELSVQLEAFKQDFCCSQEVLCRRWSFLLHRSDSRAWRTASSTAEREGGGEVDERRSATEGMRGRRLEKWRLIFAWASSQWSLRRVYSQLNCKSGFRRSR